MSKLAQGIKTVTKIVASGGIHAHDLVIADRLNTCSKCNKFKDDVCGICGCRMNSKAKYKVATCPMKYWKE
jgi:hypothetical protein